MTLIKSSNTAQSGPFPARLVLSPRVPNFFHPLWGL